MEGFVNAAHTSTGAALETKGGFKALLDNPKIDRTAIATDVDWQTVTILSDDAKKAYESQHKLARRLLGITDNLSDADKTLFIPKNIDIVKQGNVITLLKLNTTSKIMEIDGAVAKIFDDTHFIMDDIAVGASSKKLQNVKEVEIDGVRYDTDGIEIAPSSDGRIRCSGNGTYCFAQDTPLPDGVLMSEKQEGDFITAYDTEKKTSTQAKISKIRRSFTTAFTRLWIAGTMLSVTPAHALQTESGTWVAARQLEKGTQLRSITGVVRLDSTYTESVSPTPVISYELEGGLDYVVGEMPVVVAGTCDLKTIKEALGAEFSIFQNRIITLGLKSTERAALYKDFLAGNQQLRNLLKTEKGLKAWKLAEISGFPKEWRLNHPFLDKLEDVWRYDFVTTGKTAICPNIKVVPTSLYQVSDAIKTQLRSIFDNTVRKSFLQNLGNSSDITSLLKKAGFPDNEIPSLIQTLKDGKVLPGYRVHHKIPLDFGGTNDLPNLILIKENPYHAAITSFHNSKVKSLITNQPQMLDFPKVEGSFYSPPYIE